MYATDKRIIRLIDLLIFEKKIVSKNEFYSEAGLIRQTYHKIKNGSAHFTVLHIENICKKYNVNANWMIGISNKVFNNPDSTILNI